MTAIINPFDTSGYGLTEMTAAIQILPPQFTKLSAMGIFREEGVTQRSVLVEQLNGKLNLLATTPVGAPASVANRDVRSMRSFNIPWIPHEDVVLPSDIQGVRGFGLAAAADPLQVVMTRKLTRLRAKFDVTWEYMRAKALQGILVDGGGVTLYNFFTEFGLAQQATDFVLGTSTTDVGSICRAIVRYFELNLKGETATDYIVMCSPGFWDKFITHPSVKTAYQYYQNGPQPLRESVRNGFKFHGLTFMEYNSTFTLADGTTTDTAMVANEGTCFPVGTQDVFVNYFAPANLLETVNTIGQNLYARQFLRQRGDAIDVVAESSPFPINKRPDLSVRVFSSN